MTTPIASRATYLRCEFKFGVWSGDTAPTSYYEAVNFTKLEIQSQVQEFERLLSNMESTYGQVLGSVAKPTESASLSAEADYMPPYLMGLLLGADITELSQNTSAVTKEAIVLTSRLWMPLANKYIAAHGTGTEIVAKTSADAAIASTEYSIDLVNGMFKALSSAGATVRKLSYHTTTRAIENYAAGKAISNYVMLVGSATDKVSSKRGRIVVYKVNLSGSAAFDPVTGTYVKGTFGGTMLTPTGYTSPWLFQVSDLAA